MQSAVLVLALLVISTAANLHCYSDDAGGNYIYYNFINLQNLQSIKMHGIMLPTAGMSPATRLLNIVLCRFYKVENI